MRLTILIILISFCAVYSQPNTEIYLFDLNNSDGNYSISNPSNISHQNPGYDNQPHFTSDGSILYTGTNNGQTDVIRFDLQSGESENLTNSSANEYSPTPLLNRKSFSCIYDSTQNLVEYSFNNSSPKILIDNLIVGYHCWFDENTVVLFALEDIFTLRAYDIKNKSSVELDENIGRSLHKIPGNEQISYISKKTEPWTIIAINPLTEKKEVITETLEAVEDMTWTKDGTILMGKDDLLYQFKKETGWLQIADLTKFGLTGITRLAVSPDSKKIAIVVNE
jgi:hypothetical protein